MSDKKYSKTSSKSNALPIRNAAEVGMPSMQMKNYLEEVTHYQPGTESRVLSLIVGLAVIALQIYILWYTFRLERIGCKCARDFRLTYAQVYIILSVAISVALSVMEVLTDEKNVEAMSIARAALQGILFIAGVLYVIFVWQYISKLRRIKCACSTSLARDIWEVVNYIQAALLILTVLMIVVAMLYLASVYQSVYQSASAKSSKK